jgi:hypothetical protein
MANNSLTKIKIVLWRCIGWFFLVVFVICAIIGLYEGNFLGSLLCVPFIFIGRRLTRYKPKKKNNMAFSEINHWEEKNEEEVEYHIEIPEEDEPGIADAALAAASPQKTRAPGRSSPEKNEIKPIWEGKVYYLEYQAEDGSISERNIEINKIENGGRPRNSYIHAFCFQSTAMRTFRFDRIIGLYEDDREIENPFYYLTQKTNRPARVDAAALAAKALGDD